MFEQGRIYRRRDLLDRVGGQRQGGISTPKEHPLIFLFTGESGEHYGYHDGWEPNGTIRYFGEGQVGDLRFVARSKAIRDHAHIGQDLPLFKILSKRQGCATAARRRSVAQDRCFRARGPDEGRPSGAGVTASAPRVGDFPYCPGVPRSGGRST